MIGLYLAVVVGVLTLAISNRGKPKKVNEEEKNPLLEKSTNTYYPMTTLSWMKPLVVATVKDEPEGEFLMLKLSGSVDSVNLNEDGLLVRKKSMEFPATLTIGLIKTETSQFERQVRYSPEEVSSLSAVFYKNKLTEVSLQTFNGEAKSLTIEDLP